VRIVLGEGLENCFARHKLASDALVAGLTEMGLKLFGDQSHKMPNVTGVYIPDGVNGDAVRSMMLNDFGIEIGTSFGPLHGKIWRIGTMGYVCRKESVLTCLAALETSLRNNGFRARPGVDAALAAYRAAEWPSSNAKAS
jgi:(S)-ureidoglycine-glyoxylate aminotransferase